MQDDVLFIRNYEVARWPAGNPETGYLNCDGSPTKTAILEARKTDQKRYWDFCFGKRVAVELYDLKADPDCVNNLANDPQRRALRDRLEQQMVARLKQQGDPRMFGRGEEFDKMIYSAASTRNFYERFMNGEGVRAGWVNDSDFDEKLD